MARTKSEAEDGATGNTSAALLKRLIERVERVEEEIAGLNTDKKDIYAEAKGTGFDTKIMKMVIRRRKMESSDRLEQDELLELYERTLGMWSDMPLGRAADQMEQRDSSEHDLPAKRKSPPKPRELSDEEKAAVDALETKAALARMSPDGAAALAKTDHAAGKPLKANPFAARSKQRSAYDKAWCEADGSDGMSLPGEKKTPPGDGSPDDKGCE